MEIDHVRSQLRAAAGDPAGIARVAHDAAGILAAWSVALEANRPGPLARSSRQLARSAEYRASRRVSPARPRPRSSTLALYLLAGARPDSTSGWFLLTRQLSLLGRELAAVHRLRGEVDRAHEIEAGLVVQLDQAHRQLTSQTPTASTPRRRKPSLPPIPRRCWPPCLPFAPAPPTPGTRTPPPLGVSPTRPGADTREVDRPPPNCPCESRTAALGRNQKHGHRPAGRLRVLSFRDCGSNACWLPWARGCADERERASVFGVVGVADVQRAHVGKGSAWVSRPGACWPSSCRASTAPALGPAVTCDSDSLWSLPSGGRVSSDSETERCPRGSRDTELRRGCCCVIRFGRCDGGGVLHAGWRRWAR